MSIENYFTQNFTRERLTVSREGIKITETWNTPLEFKGLLNQLSGNKRLSADKLTVFATHKLYCPILDIKPKDRIKDDTGIIYEIKSVRNPMNMDKYMILELEEKGYNIDEEDVKEEEEEDDEEEEEEEDDE